MAPMVEVLGTAKRMAQSSMMPPSMGERVEGKPTCACTSAKRCGANRLTTASTSRNRTTSADRLKLVQNVARGEVRCVKASSYKGWLGLIVV